MPPAKKCDALGTVSTRVATQPASSALVGEVAAVFTRTEACLSGAVLATAAYVTGDLEMAANAQAAASAAPDPTAIMPGPR